MKIHIILFSTAVLSASLASAQDAATDAPPPVTRKALLPAELTPPKSVARVEISAVTLAPGQAAPLHLHPCPVVGVINAGHIAFQIDGEPVRHLGAGDAFYEPAHARVARFDNEGGAPATFTAFYLLGTDEHELIRILEKPKELHP